jgi:hypothetical protein
VLRPDFGGGPAAIVRDDGTVYQRVITIGVGFGGSDCFASGSLSS